MAELTKEVLSSADPSVEQEKSGASPAEGAKGEKVGEPLPLPIIGAASLVLGFLVPVALGFVELTRWNMPSRFFLFGLVGLTLWLGRKLLSQRLAWPLYLVVIALWFGGIGGSRLAAGALHKVYLELTWQDFRQHSSARNKQQAGRQVDTRESGGDFFVDPEELMSGQ